MHIIPPMPAKEYQLSDLSTVQPTSKGQEVFVLYSRTGPFNRFGCGEVESMEAGFFKGTITVQGKECDGKQDARCVKIDDVCCRVGLTSEDVNFAETSLFAADSGDNDQAPQGDSNNDEEGMSTTVSSIVTLTPRQTKMQDTAEPGEQKSENIENTDTRFPVIGIPNTSGSGLACYRNSAIQFLFGMDRAYFMGLLTKLDNNEHKGQAVRYKFRHFVTEYSKAPPLQACSKKACEALEKIASEVGTEYSGHTQEDTHLFLDALLTKLGIEEGPPFGFVHLEHNICSRCTR
jgi:hypothetical protein